MTNSKLSSFVSSSFDFVAQSTSQRVCSQLCWPHVSYQTGQTESSQMFLLLGQKKNLAMKCLELNVCFCLFHLRFMHKALPSICVCSQLCCPHLWLPDRPAKKVATYFLAICCSESVSQWFIHNKTIRYPKYHFVSMDLVAFTSLPYVHQYNPFLITNYSWIP